MKKTLFILAATITVTTTSFAQDNYRKNIFGIRAGYSLSDMTNNFSEGEKRTDPRSSFHIGVSNQLLLSRWCPLYLETGLYLSNKGTKSNVVLEDQRAEVRPRIELMYLQLPVMITYHFRLGHAATIQPFVGGYYAVGLSGKLKAKYSGPITGTSTADLLHGDGRDGENPQILKRSDAGIRLGVGFTLSNCYLGVGYEIGLMNVAKYPDLIGGKRENNALTISVGYNF